MLGLARCRFAAGAMGVSPDPEKRGEAERHRRYRGTQRTAWGI